MQTVETEKAQLYVRYPLSSVILYNGITVLHFGLGGLGIAMGYRFLAWAGSLFGMLYLILSLAEMYVLMPLVVCPNCVYHRAWDSRCISGLNLLSKKIAGAGNSRDFARRAEGPFCPNNLYLASLVLPILVILPALALNFSLALLGILLSIIGLLLFRFFIIFPKLACLHCSAKFQCPQAAAMGVRDL